MTKSMLSSRLDAMRLIIGISGASGAIYGITLLKVLSTTKEVETHLVISEAAELTIRQETDWKLKDVRALATCAYDIHDIGARIASGSFQRDAMIIAPCSVKTMSALANSYAENLLVRAGDVTLKERKPLVVVLRETPLHLGHIKNMLQLTQMGAIIFPPVPSFYGRPGTIEALVKETVGRVLDLVNIKHNLLSRWEGTSHGSQNT